MIKRIRLISVVSALSISLLFVSCQLGKTNVQTRKFASEYSAIRVRYVEGLNAAQSEEERAALLKYKIKELEGLLRKYDKRIANDDDEAELLKSKVLIEMSRFAAANIKLGVLIDKQSPFIIDAKMTKVQLLIAAGERVQALRLLKEIEPQLQKEINRLSAWYYFAMYSEDIKVMDVYSKKILDVPDLPETFSKYKGRLYRNLAAAARDAGRLEEARQMLQKALSVTPAAEMKMKRVLEMELDQLDFPGKPAPPISADIWFNASPSSPGSPGQLKGKAAIIMFWAPWCSACRRVIPLLNENYDKYKEKGLVVIGCTKLYGTYRDETREKEHVNKEEEAALIKEYIERNGVTYPNSISYEGNSFEDYKIAAVPALIFIDKDGNVNDMKTGADQLQLINYKIKRLLEETNGEDKNQ
jgi:thiol-disulfide isomerase/thioredoxin